MMKTPKAIHRYLLTQLFASIVGESALAGALGDVSNATYTEIFLALSIGVYWAMGQIVKESLRAHPSRVVAFIVSGAITSCVAGSMLGHVAGPFDWLTLLDAAVLVFMGVCVGMGAATQSRAWQHTSLVLMAFWFAQAIFEYGLTFHVWNPEWMRMNQWVPAILTSAGCAWVSQIARIKGRRAEA